MTPVRVLVVDDERPARERIRRLLARDERVCLAGVCGSGAEALAVMRDAAAQREGVDVLLLDVQMPEVDGFAVVKALVDDGLPRAVPTVVFVTAYDSYALKAFEANAVDYLLKPFSDERFRAALDRAILRHQAGLAQDALRRLHGWFDGGGASAGPAHGMEGPGPERPGIDRLVVRDGHRLRLVPVAEVTWIKADGVYVTVHTRDGASLLHRASLTALEVTLDGHQFLRIHRSAIVNIDLVRELRQDEAGDYQALLADGTRVPVGRRFRDRLMARLGR